MATNFPTSIDALVNPIATDSLATVNHADQHTNANDAIEALEAKVGVNGSAVTSSLDYKIANIPATSITSGTLNNARLPAAATTITSVGTLTGLIVNGDTTIGSVPVVGRSFVVNKAITGSTTSHGITASGTIQSDVTSYGTGFNSSVNTAASAFTLTELYHFLASGVATPGAGSTITTQNGFAVNTNLTGAANNYAFHGSVNLGANSNWNIYMDGSAPNYLRGTLGINTKTTGSMLHVINDTVGNNTLRLRNIAAQTGLSLQIVNSSAATFFGIDTTGNVGIGATPSALSSLTINKPLTGGIVSYGIYANQAIQSDVTNTAMVYTSRPATAAQAFTLGNLTHFRVYGVATPGAGSTINAQTGYFVDASLTGAGTSNYAFRGSVPTSVSASTNYNLFMDGTAQNYVRGRLGVGATLTSGAMAQVTNTTAADKAFVVKGAASQSGDLFDIQNSAGVSQFKVNSAGNVGIGGISGNKLYVGQTVDTGFGIVVERTTTDVQTTGLISLISRSPTTGVFLRETEIRLRNTDTTANNYTSISNYNASSPVTSSIDFINIDHAYSGAIRFNTRSSVSQYGERMRIDATGNILVGMTSTATSSAKTIHIGNGTAPTANPASGGVLYVESGALKYRGSSGTVTTIANA